MPGATWHEVLYNFVVIYLVFTFVLTLYSVIRMYVVKHKCNGVKYGKERIETLTSQGRWKQIPIYTPEECYENKDLRTVRLSVFPNDSEEKSKYVIVLPGGGYAHCCTKDEGFPVAAKFNELGYTAFMLEYRTGSHCSPYAPMQDLARAICHIESNAELYHVEVEGYALCGFSAGGNLAGIYASHHHGYEEFGTRKPGVLLLGYPWTNVWHWLDHPYWNIWKGIMGVWLSERGYIYMFGRHVNKENRESLCVQNQVTSDYVPTYIFTGGLDVLTPASHHAQVMAKALEDHKVPCKYRQYFGLPHGIGIAKGTAAEGWMQEAIDFWKEMVKEDV